MMSETQIEEFKKVCLPVVEFLQKNCCPHDTVVIKYGQFKIVSDEISFPVTEFGE